jgi:aspartyl-tRNA(Asn)/glutamyl-tRNA(Gln) amidotransferase subunit A
MTSLAFAKIADLSAALDRQTLSPLELLEDVLARIERLEPALNMFATLDPDGARRAAKAAAERQLKGARLSPLDGIPTAVKDLIAQQGLPLRFGSRSTFAETYAGQDAPVVERLRSAGAVLLGKSTTSEFGCKAVGDSPLTGVTRNPWDPDMTPGGSSCGAAAMVAAGIVPYAIGTDGGGSIRIPAALTGLFGLKGQFGRVPVFPTSATPTLAHVGPLSRTIEDAAVVMNAIACHDLRDPFSVAGPVPDFNSAVRETRPLKIAWSPTLGYARPDGDVLALTEAAVQNLERLGHMVELVPEVMTDPVDLWNAEFYAGVGTRLRRVIKEAPEDLDPAVLEVLEAAMSQDMGAYYAKVFARYDFREEMRRFFEKFDLLVSPTLPVAAVPVGCSRPRGLEDRSIVSWVFYTYPFNLTGQPAASMPVGFNKEGMPVGLQVVGKINDECTILSLCGAYERAFGQLARRPQIAV